MPVRTDQAIVLRLTDYSETSQIVTLFTAKAGLVRLIAKGSRRGTRTRFAAGLDLLEYGEVSYAPARGEAGLGTLTEWVQRDAFTGLRAELVRQYGGLYAVELVSKLTEEYDPHPELFDALLGLLRGLAGGPGGPPQAPGAATDPIAVIVRFQGALLKAIGYAPILDHCVGCGTPRVRGTRAYFSSSAGGLICRDCEMHHVEKRRISSTMLDGGPSGRSAVDWIVLLDYHLTSVAERSFKTGERLLRLLIGSPSNPKEP
jgi:DNA repair protein RecO (recombination protein O)